MQPELLTTPDYIDEFMRAQLLERREKLEEYRSAFEVDPEIARLFNEVDAALARLDKGDFGVCEECHKNIEAERLIADPLVRFCLCSLSEAEQNALERDIELAASIQGSLLPNPELKDSPWEIGYKYEPAGMVSGDYLDLIDSGDGGFYFLLGDVSGKGMAASLLMSNLQAMFRALVPGDFSLGELMKRANNLFCESTPSSHYVTLVCGKAHSNGEVELSNAGHLPPVLVHNGEKKMLECAGLPMGMFCSSSYSTTKHKFAPGDTLLLYTDGITESLNHAGEEYGIERFVGSINGAPTLDGHISECLDRLSAFRNGHPRHDDLTIMGLAFKG